jgi:hypothetical protein
LANLPLESSLLRNVHYVGLQGQSGKSLQTNAQDIYIPIHAELGPFADFFRYRLCSAMCRMIVKEVNNSAMIAVGIRSLAGGGMISKEM